MEIVVADGRNYDQLQFRLEILGKKHPSLFASLVTITILQQLVIEN